MTEAAIQLHKESTSGFNPEQIALIKTTVAKGTTNDELSLFLYTAKRTGLDPLMKQIHAIKRWSSKDKREVMTIQTGIDGLRLIADRTDRYAPGPEPVIEEDPAGNIIKATAYIEKRVGVDWHTVGATAYYKEYVQLKDGVPMGLWAKMPRLMTAKCAEALALRKAFPAEMSGVYTFDEMTQADSEHGSLPPAKTVEAKSGNPDAIPPDATVENQTSPPPAPTFASTINKKPEDITTDDMKREMEELSQIATDSGKYGSPGEAIQEWCSDEKFHSKCRSVAGLKAPFAIKKAWEKMKVDMGITSPEKANTSSLDEERNDDIKF